VDLPTIDPARRHPRLALRILQALARNVGMDYVVTRIVQDASTDDSDIARSTVYDYLAPLERLMMLDPLEAWSSHLRSRARLRTSPRVQFCDPSVVAAALRAGPDLRFAPRRDLGRCGLAESDAEREDGQYDGRPA